MKKPLTDANEHILDALLAYCAVDARPARLPAAFRRYAARHLATCLECQIGLAVLEEWTEYAQIASEPVSQADRQPAAQTSAQVEAQADENLADQEPDDEDLALYATITAAQGSEIATARLPLLAAHLSSCADCQQVIEELLEEQEVQPATQAIAPEPTSVEESSPETTDWPELPPSATPWLVLWRQDDATKRTLVEPYVVVVGDHTVRISSPLPAPHIVVEYSSAVTFRGAAAPARERDSAAQGEPEPQQEQSFAVDLRDETDTASSWLRAKVHLRALATGRVIALVTTWRVTAEDETGVQVGGVPWVLDTFSADGAHELIAGDTTEAEQPTKASWKRRGAHALTFQALGRSWVIPFSLDEAPLR